VTFITNRAEARPGPAGNGRSGLGGAIYAEGCALRVGDAVFDGNYARGANGTIRSITSGDGYDGGNGLGGAIYVIGSTIALGTADFVENYARGGDGSDATGDENDGGEGGDGRGGAVYLADGSFEWSAVTMTSNATWGGPGGDGTDGGSRPWGGCSDGGDGGDGGDGLGAAIYLGGSVRLTLRGSSVKGNVANRGDRGLRGDAPSDCEDGDNGDFGEARGGGAYRASGSNLSLIDSEVADNDPDDLAP
jgi:hypothetical protein